MRKIITDHVYPASPFRCFDWCAFYDDEGAENQNYGWGRTEQEAINDLRGAA